MKKLFISCPMKGRTEEAIRKSMEKMHKIAEVYFDQELEVIPSYIEHKPPENSNQSVWYLGRSIQLMAEADYYIGIEFSDFFKGCYIENHVARSYGIRSVHVNTYELMPDANEVEMKWHNSMLAYNTAMAVEGE